MRYCARRRAQLVHDGIAILARRLSLPVAALALVGAQLALAQGLPASAGAASPGAGNGAPAATERSVSEWLMRMHDASRRRAYIGTYVVSSGAKMESARIWHICDGVEQVERIEGLTGTPRSTFRRNDQVITFLPESRVAWSETRESLGLFPTLLRSVDSSIGQFYSARMLGAERVAGFDSDVVQLQPRDRLRYGYRIWSEKKTGLVVKMQTLDIDERVLEQAAFSELQLDAPVSMQRLTQMMANTHGYKVERPELVKTTALAEGWELRTLVAGFKPMSCYRRLSVAAKGAATSESTLQWVFSDGLASVSLFVEPFDAQRHAAPGSVALGATQTATRRIAERGADKSGDWWLTAVGEVPASTLSIFVRGVERRRAAPN